MHMVVECIWTDHQNINYSKLITDFNNLKWLEQILY